MNNDERLKEKLILKSKNGYAIISVFNADVTCKNRHNSKKSRVLQNMIIEAGFAFKAFTSTMSNGDIKKEFVIFEKFDDGFNDTGIRLKEFLENCRNHFTNFTVQYNLEDYLKDKIFYHPLLKSEKAEYNSRKEIILEDLFEPPEYINGWSVRKVISETHVIYERNEILCGISLLPDGTWQRSYGKIKPVGVQIKKEILKNRDEAFSNLLTSFKKAPDNTKSN